MNERIRELREQAGLQPYYDAQEGQIEKFAELIVREICDIVEEDGSAVLPLVIKRHFGVEERKHIGYIEREEGYYKLYTPLKSQIVTHAFILCKYCNSVIYHCTGPKSDAVCFTCYEKDPDLR